MITAGLTPAIANPNKNDHSNGIFRINLFTIENEIASRMTGKHANLVTWNFILFKIDALTPRPALHKITHKEIRL